MSKNRNTDRLRVGAPLLVLCVLAGLSAGCAPKQARTPEQDRSAFSADPSRMPPEARIKMLEAQCNGGRRAPQGAPRR